MTAPKARAIPWRSLAAYAAHFPVVAWVFSGALFAGQVPYFRDVAVYYYPNYVFLERSLRQGVWPLWNPTSDAGAPFLASDPIDLLLVGLLGAAGALRFGPPLHLALAMTGCSRLATTLGMGPLGGWAAGLFYGLSGYVLSTANLFQPFHATAWAPWVLAAGLRMWASPSPRGIAALASLAAVQVSTLGAETVLQTALVGLCLLQGRPDRHRLGAGVGAALLALLLSAPAILGTRALVLGTARAEGFSHLQSFAHSLSPVALLDTVFPRFFGDVHTFSDVGYWGQPFFPSGYPYLLSLYLGPGILWLAARSGPVPARRRLVGLGLLGVLLALGTHGPLEWLLTPLMRSLRAPSKFLFLTTLAACLLAGAGLQRASRESRPGFALPGLGAATLLLGLAAVTRVSPELPGKVLGGALPEILDPRALFVIRTAWPAALAVSGILLLGAALASRSRVTAPLAGILLGLDLLLVNGQVNLSTAPAFYDLRPEVARLVAQVRTAGDWRFFAYGGGNVPGLRWAEEVARRNSDVWLYYVDRQALVPRTHVIDGLFGAFDEDRAGWAPPGSALSARERIPSATGSTTTGFVRPTCASCSRSVPSPTISFPSGTRRSCPRFSNRCASTRSATPCRGPSGPTASSSWRTGTSCSDASPPRRSTRGRWPSSRIRPIRRRTDRHRPRRGRTRCATSSRTPIRCASSARVRPDGWSFSTVTTPTGGPIRTETPGRFCGPMADIGRWRPAVAARC